MAEIAGVEVRAPIGGVLAEGRVQRWADEHEGLLGEPRGAHRGGDVGERAAHDDLILPGGTVDDRHRGLGWIAAGLQVGHDVAATASRLAQDLNLGGRISLRRRSSDDLTADDIAQMARYVADRARAAPAKIRPARIHFVLAAPAAFAVLLGYHMTALQSDIIAYEDDAGSYTESLTLPHDTT